MTLNMDEVQEASASSSAPTTRERESDSRDSSPSGGSDCSSLATKRRRTSPRKSAKARHAQTKVTSDMLNHHHNCFYILKYDLKLIMQILKLDIVTWQHWECGIFGSGNSPHTCAITAQYPT